MHINKGDNKIINKTMEKTTTMSTTTTTKMQNKRKRNDTTPSLEDKMSHHLDDTPNTKKKTFSIQKKQEDNSADDVKPVKKKLKFFDFERNVDASKPLGTMSNPVFFSSSGKPFDTYTNVTMNDFVEDGLSQVDFLNVVSNNNNNNNNDINNSTLSSEFQIEPELADINEKLIVGEPENNEKDIEVSEVDVDIGIDDVDDVKKISPTNVAHDFGFCTWADEKRHDDSIRDLSVAEDLLNTHFNNAKGDAHYNKQTYYDEHLL